MLYKSLRKQFKRTIKMQLSASNPSILGANCLYTIPYLMYAFIKL